MSVTSHQNQSKRQREWVYLCHYLAITGLDPVHIISGQDDGQEPDFTLVFYWQQRFYYVGVELTTLPRLRDQMGDKGLISKRWYWQSLQIMAKHQAALDEQQYFQLPITTLYMPATIFEQRLQYLPHSAITQKDVNAVMDKKAHKVPNYQIRRTLDELWLLIHTDKYQPTSILTVPKTTVQTSKSKQLKLTHHSGFNRVHITRYPSHKLIDVSKSTSDK
ncbi:hypothetical protein [Psychrobacter sp. I-STPA10]|uniref:hypothetical protein n=1 Tax=Psychrobacter sp. I-STPA10 TaxID=2585769 RepID=UPI001E460F12|nr:hypothetical protein [Psychrobacter sp. I-STPA10]